VAFPGVEGLPLQTNAATAAGGPLVRKRSKYRPKGVRLDNMAYVKESVKPVVEHENYLITLKLANSEAMVALMRGTATKRDMDTLIAMSNIVEALHRLGFGGEYGEVAVAGREALLGIVHRAVTIKRFVPNAEQITALQLLMELHDAQMDVITIKDMERAMAYAKTQFANKKATVLPHVEELTK
jgi:hypothetical protein